MQLTEMMADKEGIGGRLYGLMRFHLILERMGEFGLLEGWMKSGVRSAKSLFIGVAGFLMIWGALGWDYK